MLTDIRWNPACQPVQRVYFPPAWQQTDVRLDWRYIPQYPPRDSFCKSDPRRPDPEDNFERTALLFQSSHPDDD